MTNKGTVLVLSARPIFRECLVSYLRQHGCPEAVGAADLRAHGRVAGERSPGLVLFDLAGGGDGDPRAAVHQLRRRWPRARVVALGTPAQLGANAGEADGCVELCRAHARDVAAIATGDLPRGRGRVLEASPETEAQRRRWRTVTERERHVLDLLACGADNQTIALSLGITERTVKAHLARLFSKLHASNRTGLALTACRAGLHCAHDGGAVPRAA
jgi:DNA-binding NarL/FixJ family response regulator